MKNIDTVLGLLLSVMASIPAFATSPVEERHDALVNDHKIVFSEEVRIPRPIRYAI